RGEIDLQLTDRDHRGSAGARDAGHELPHAQRGGGGQQAGDGAAARATHVSSAPLHLHVLYSVRRRRGFAWPRIVRGRDGGGLPPITPRRQTLAAPATNSSRGTVSARGGDPP